jgi:predicted ABC-type ATPase
MLNRNVIILSGSNGAGKSTAAPAVLVGALAVEEFVNADAIARGLSAFNPDAAALESGRVMLRRLDELAASGANFAFETTLASRSFAAKLEKWIAAGYFFHLYHFWLPSPEMSVARVAGRVYAGGHHIPAETIRRRYHAGLSNFFELYKPLAFSWKLFDNTNKSERQLIAAGSFRNETQVVHPALWKQLKDKYDHETRS